MKVVHCAIFNELQFAKEFYSTDRKISEGLILNEHYVYNFSYRDLSRFNILLNKKFGIKKMNKSLIKVIKNIKPELLLLGHTELISNDTLIEIKKILPTVKIGMWWVDWVYNLKNISSFSERLKLIDKFFITSDIEELKKVDVDAELINKCLYLPNIASSTIDTKCGFEKKEYKYDLLFIGRKDKQREELINFLKTNFNDIRVGIFGVSKENLIFGEEYLELIASSKLAINYNRDNTLLKYSSDRVIHLAANGVAILSPMIPKFETVFNKSEIIYFKDFIELKELIYKYLKDDNQRKTYARNSYLKAHNEYNSKKITAFMIEKIFEGK